jgi:hypothetical protein
MKIFIVLLALAALSGAAFSLPDTCRIFIWDNDAGESAQEMPAAAMTGSRHSVYVWSDRRDGNWNVYGQRYHRSVYPLGGNFLVNPWPDAAHGSQRSPAVASDASGNFVVVYRDSNPDFWGNYKYNLSGVLFDYNGIQMTGQFPISKDDNYHKFTPRLSRRRDDGDFAVVWCQQVGSAGYEIVGRLLDPDGGYLTDTLILNDVHTYAQSFPSVGFCDSGIVVVWQDFRSNNYWQIYARQFYPDFTPMGPSFLVCGGSSNNTFLPDVSVSGKGMYTIVWEDNRSGQKIFGRRYSWSGTVGNEFEVSDPFTYRNLRPSVTMVQDSSFAVAWQDSVASFNYQIQTRLRYYPPYPKEPGSIWTPNEKSFENQCTPAVCSFGVDGINRLSVAWLDSLRWNGRGDIMGQYYNVVVEGMIDSILPLGSNYRIDNTRAAGRKVWYHPKKNYDNPATPDWNEDPIDEPDSIYIPLDSAFVRAFAERNNVPGQKFVIIRDTDTLAEDYQGQGKSTADGYDVMVVNLGYATDAAGAGEIGDAQMDSIEKFSDSGGALLCSGGDFGEMYNGTSLYNQYFAANYLGPGNPLTIGNIDSLGGMDGTFTQGMKFHYPFQQEPDNSIDFIAPGSYGGYNAETIFMNDGPGPVKWAYCRSIAYSSFWKGTKFTQRSNIYIPFAMGSLISDGSYPNTQSELTRRILTFQGFDVEPSPVHDLAASSIDEGRVDITWTAPCDDALTEAASAYQLKYSWYNAVAPDLGKLSSESDYVDSGHVFYQAWTPSSPGSAESEQLRGMPPGDTIILAMKAGDGNSPRLWSELGNEPRVVVAGDRVTPHVIGIGYGFGCVRDFISTERIGIRYEDTLFCTWAASNVYFGYSRCDWRTAGDLLIYMDTRTGGADSTYDHNGSGAKSAFDTGGDFRPDFCLVVDSDAYYAIKSWNSGTGAWRDSLTVFPGSAFSMDSINNYEYTEIRVPFGYIGDYDTTRAFRYLVVCQQEASNTSWSAFPTQNTPGKDGKAPARYPYYYEVAGGLRSGLYPSAASGVLAVELAEFSAMATGSGVTLTWRTESESDNYQWLIDRSTQPDAGYQRVATVPGRGNTPNGHSYSFTDGSVLPDMTYYYRLGDQDLQQNITWHGPISVYTGDQSLVREFLADCRPNPAKGAAEIRFSLPSAGIVELSVYDVSGRLVRSFGRQWLGIGQHTTRWDCADQAGRKVPSGVYFYRLAADGGDVLKGRMTVIR